MPTSIGRSWFIQGMTKLASRMAEKESPQQRQGSISLRLLYEDIEPYQDVLTAREKNPIADRIPGIGGQYYLVTGSTASFRDLPPAPEESLSILRMSPDGDSYKPLWGLRGNAVVPADLPAHLRAHDVRQRATLGSNRVILQSRASLLSTLASLPELSTPALTRALWEMSSQALKICPDGVAILPHTIPAASSLGREIAVCMRRHRLVVWPSQSVFAAGETLQKAFELFDTTEYAAETLVKLLASGGPKVFMPNRELRKLAEKHQVKPFAAAMEFHALDLSASQLQVLESHALDLHTQESHSRSSPPADGRSSKRSSLPTPRRSQKPSDR
jgi:rhamnulose-1-phosphate aldolase